MTNVKTFVKSGNTVRVRDKQSMQAYDELPPLTYTIKFDQNANEFFLEEIDGFELPAKIYGKNTNYAKRILDTFNNRDGQTGVMLNGIKGAGKTLLAKQTSVMAREQGIPTIVINRDWHGDEFNSFIQSITTPTLIMFDEFEKIYGWAEQRKVLTLFDGVFNSRKLFMVTTNEEREISEFMRNRPGRIYYNFKFDTLDQSFIKEYLEDRLDNKAHIDGVLKYTSIFSFFNFDMLSAAVEEMNRYGETLSEVLEVLNITPENLASDTYKLDLHVLGREFTLDKDYSGFQPNSFEYYLWGDDSMPDLLQKDPEVKSLLLQVMQMPSEEGNSYVVSHDDDYILFSSSMIKEFDQNTNTFVYSIERDGANVQLRVTRNDPLAKWAYNPNLM
jgi:hypothetical protein